MWADMMMARGGRLFDGSEMAAILHGEGLPPGTIEALLASTPPPPTCYGGQRPMMSFDAGGARGSTTPDRPLLPPRRSYTPPMLMMNNDSDLDEYSGFFQEHAHSNQSDSKKRRLSPDQVLFLERSFEADNKLEPERKAELARSLGLQPRQVAIWFQNRRARWKTKQLERDFEAVREGYEGLKREFDAARKEKEKLEAEVNYLREQLLNRQKRRRSSVDTSDEIQLQCPASITHQERKTKASFAAEEPAPPQQEQMLTIQQEEPAETDHSGLSHVAEEEDFDDVVAAAAAATTCRYDFPTGVVDDHHPLWLWQPAEFCGP